MDTTTSHTLEGKKRNGEHILINMTYVSKNIGQAFKHFP